MEDLTSDEMIDIIVDETTGREPPRGPAAPEFRASIREDIAFVKENGGQIEVPWEWEVEVGEDTEKDADPTPFLTDGLIDQIVDTVIKGGPGSGNWGHTGGEGGPGKRGGSSKMGQAQTAFSQFVKQEGASVSMRGNPPKTGYMLSPYKERELRIRLPKDRSQINRSELVERFKKFREDNKDLLKQKGHYFGAWVSKGILYLDVSVNEKDFEIARRLAKRHKQLALWDVKNGKEVATKSEKSIELFLFPGMPSDADLEKLADDIIASYSGVEEKAVKFLDDNLTDMVGKQIVGKAGEKRERR